MASPLGMIEGDPAQGPSAGPRDDIAGWPGAVPIEKMAWRLEIG